MDDRTNTAQAAGLRCSPEPQELDERREGVLAELVSDARSAEPRIGITVRVRGIEHFLIEVGNRPEIVPLKKLHVVGCLKPLDVDAYVVEQLMHDGICMARVNDRLRAAVRNTCNTVYGVFVAFRMATEIIVIVENQDFLVVAVLLLKKSRRR